MGVDIGPQYELDDAFKAAARLHQSKYRAEVLGAGYSKYGNRLEERSARNLANYYPGLNVRHELRMRYPKYSRKRDADMLRSEHIPFNLFAPLMLDGDLAGHVIAKAFGIACRPPFRIRFEWAPSPKERYLGDLTSFDTYIQFEDTAGRAVGIGIEVKYTEREYSIGDAERARVEDPNSTYWRITRDSRLFRDASNMELASEKLRQIWRNHLLGLAMCAQNKLASFISVVVYPMGNGHIARAVQEYRHTMLERHIESVRPCTFEQYIDAIEGSSEIEEWKEYLTKRYLVS